MLASMDVSLPYRGPDDVRNGCQWTHVTGYHATLLCFFQSCPSPPNIDELRFYSITLLSSASRPGRSEPYVVSTLSLARFRIP